MTAIIQIFDKTLLKIFGNCTPLFFFLSRPTVDALRELRQHLGVSTKKVWPPETSILKKFQYCNKSNIKFVDKVRNSLEKYIDTRLFYKIYVEGLNYKKRMKAFQAMRYIK